MPINEEDDVLTADENVGVLSVLNTDLGDVDSVYRVDIQPGLYIFEVTGAKVVPREITVDKKTQEKAERPEVQFELKIDEIVKLASNADKTISEDQLLGKIYVERRVQLPTEDLKVWLGTVAGYMRSMTNKSIKGQLSDELADLVGARFKAVIKQQKDRQDPTIVYPRLEYKGPKSFVPV